MTDITHGVTRKGLTTSISFEYHDQDFLSELLTQQLQSLGLNNADGVLDQIEALLHEQAAQMLQTVSADTEAKILELITTNLPQGDHSQT